VATGTALAQALDLPLYVLEDIHELGGIYRDDPGTGRKTGLPGYGKLYFAEHYPDLILPDAMNPEGWWSREYEPLEQRPARAQKVLKNIMELHENTQDRVALISHGGFYNLFLKTLLQIADTQRYWFNLNNTGITRIDFQEGWVGLVYCNRMSFLPDSLIT
jgi:2,3-bisphosphoglycerate-dependent phosphoglycerate mutase